MSAAVNTSSPLVITDRDHPGHTWRADGRVYSTVQLGQVVSIRFDSAADARAVGERCLKAAEAIDAMNVQGGTP